MSSISNQRCTLTTWTLLIESKALSLALIPSDYLRGIPGFIVDAESPAFWQLLQGITLNFGDSKPKYFFLWQLCCLTMKPGRHEKGIRKKLNFYFTCNLYSWKSPNQEVLFVIILSSSLYIFLSLNSVCNILIFKCNGFGLNCTCGKTPLFTSSLSWSPEASVSSKMLQREVVRSRYRVFCTGS